MPANPPAVRRNKAKGPKAPAKVKPPAKALVQRKCLGAFGKLHFFSSWGSANRKCPACLAKEKALHLSRMACEPRTTAPGTPLLGDE